MARPGPSSYLTPAVLSTDDSEHRRLTSFTSERQSAMVSESKVSTPWAEREEGDLKTKRAMESTSAGRLPSSRLEPSEVESGLWNAHRSP